VVEGRWICVIVETTISAVFDISVDGFMLIGVVASKSIFTVEHPMVPKQGKSRIKYKQRVVVDVDR
jgi:hypothetical protein